MKPARIPALADQAEINPRDPIPPELRDNALVSFVPMQAVSELTATVESRLTRPLREVRKGYTRFRSGDVLFAKITPCMENGKAALTANLENNIGFGSTEFHVIRPNEPKTARLLWYFVRRPSFRSAAKQQMRGAAGQQRVPEEFVASSPGINPAVLADQRRIVEILDLADELRRRRREAVEIARRIPTAAFHTAFDGVLDLFKPSTVEQVFDDTSRMGPRLPRTTYLSSGRFPVIDQGADMVAGFTDRTEDLYTGPLPVVLFGDHTRVFKLIRHPFAIGADGVRLLAPRSGWLAEFAFQQCRMLDIPSAGYSRHFKFLREQAFFHASPAKQSLFAEAFREHESILENQIAAQNHLDSLFTTLLERAFAGGLTREGRSGTMRETLQEMEIQSRRQP